jgi:hypothetical protein
MGASGIPRNAVAGMTKRCPGPPSRAALSPSSREQGCRDKVTATGREPPAIKGQCVAALHPKPAGRRRNSCSQNDLRRFSCGGTELAIVVSSQVWRACQVAAEVPHGMRQAWPTNRQTGVAGGVIPNKTGFRRQRPAVSEEVSVWRTTKNTMDGQYTNLPVSRIICRRPRRRQMITR